jgi:HAD superfamily hydrolase (TIGR01509 family)
VAGALFERQLGEPGRAAQIVAELDELVFSELEKGIEPMAGARDLVAALREREVPIAIASNSPARFIARALELVGLHDAFAVQVSGHEVPAPKPAPDVYLAACEHLGVTADRAVVVLEDSPTGVASGIAAGLTVIGVPSLPGVELDAAHHLHGSLADAKLRARLGLPTG